MYPMRISVLTSILLLALLTKASLFSPFLTALDPWNEQIITNETSFELLKRQSNACPTSYKACTNEGVPGLCCANSQICTSDNNGYVACCPSGATCTGTITGIVTGGTIGGGGGLATGTTSNTGLLTSAASSTTSNGLVLASATSTTTGTGTATSTNGFIIASGTTVATIGSSGVRNIKTPLYARLVIRMLELIPL